MCPEINRFSWTVIMAISDQQQFMKNHGSKFSLFWKVSSDQTIHVFVIIPFPGGDRLSKEGFSI
jgi:hypothetical protein